MEISREKIKKFIQYDTNTSEALINPGIDYLII